MHPITAKIIADAHARDLHRLMHPEAIRRPRPRLGWARKTR